MGRERRLKQTKRLDCFQEYRKQIQDGGGGACLSNSVGEDRGQSPQAGACLELKVTTFLTTKWRDKMVSGCWVEVKTKQ